MAVVSKKKPAAPVAATTATVAKKTVAPVKKAAEAPVKNVEVSEKKKLASLNKNTKTSKSFEIKEGSQATQEAFIDRFYKKLVALGWESISKEQTKAIKKAYSETLKEVTDIASFQDVDAGMYYARRYITARVTQPPKAKDGLKTLMNGHYELKVRKLLGNEDDFKFFGDVSEDGTTFITEDGQEIALVDEVEVKPAAKKVVAKKAPVVEAEEVEEEEDLIEDEVDDDDFDDFLDEEDED
jgi:hypothetical protein